jgi:hypothetical protein
VPLVSAELPPPIIELQIEEPQENLPLLGKSDDEFGGWLRQLFGAEPLTTLVVPQRLIRNIVVTIDNLPRQQVAPQQRPLRPTPGRFVTEGTEDDLVIAPENYARYDAVMSLVRATDPRVAAALFRRVRPFRSYCYVWAWPIHASSRASCGS